MEEFQTFMTMFTVPLKVDPERAFSAYNIDYMLLNQNDPLDHYLANSAYCVLAYKIEDVVLYDVRDP